MCGSCRESHQGSRLTYLIRPATLLDASLETDDTGWTGSAMQSTNAHAGPLALATQVDAAQESAAAQDVQAPLINEDELRAFIRSPTVDTPARMGGAAGVHEREDMQGNINEKEAAVRGSASTGENKIKGGSSLPLPPNQQVWRVATGVVASGAPSTADRSAAGGSGIRAAGDDDEQGVRVPGPTASSGDTTRMSSQAVQSSFGVTRVSIQASSVSSGATTSFGTTSSQPGSLAASTPLRPHSLADFGAPSATPSRIFGFGTGLPASAGSPLLSPASASLPSQEAGVPAASQEGAEGADAMHGKRKAGEGDLDLGRARKAMRYSFGGSG